MIAILITLESLTLNRVRLVVYYVHVKVKIKDFKGQPKSWIIGLMDFKNELA